MTHCAFELVVADRSNSAEDMAGPHGLRIVDQVSIGECRNGNIGNLPNGLLKHDARRSSRVKVHFLSGFTPT